MATSVHEWRMLVIDWSTGASMKPMLPLGIIGLLATAAPVFAVEDQAGPAVAQVPQGSESLSGQSFIPSSPTNPFARVFRAQDLTEQERLRLAAELLRARTPNTEVICGLTVRHVGERDDPRIIVPRHDQQVDAKIRRIAPDVCRKERKP